MKRKILIAIPIVIAITAVYIIFTTYQSKPLTPFEHIPSVVVTEPEMTEPIEAQETIDPEEIPLEVIEEEESEETTTATAETTAPEPTTEEPYVPKISERYESILEINKDIVGQLYIPDGDINYYVLYSGDDFYLRRDIYGNYSNGGSVYMDKNNTGQIDRNTMLHAHNFGSYGMFYPLEKYKNKEYFDSHRRIIFNSLYADMEWEVIGVYVVPSNNHFIKTKFNSDKSFLEFVDKILETSLFKVDYVPDKDDKILTLNTCSYEYKNAHTIVHARLVKTTYHK